MRGYLSPLIDNPFTWLYFPTALALGALHALEPGHAKTLTAAYLIGIKGTKRDAFLLGLSVASTHSVVVVARYFANVKCLEDTHKTPWGAGQNFVYCGFKKR